MDMKLGRLVAAGIYSSHVACRGRAVSKNRKATMFEIELPTEAGGISYIDKCQMHISPDTVICAKPGQIRHTTFPFKCYYIHLILEGGTLYDVLLGMPDFIKIEKREEYADIFKRIIEYYDTALEIDEIIVHSLILELVWRLAMDVGQALPEGRERSHNTAVQKAVEYIKENLTYDLSLKSVAAYAGFSPIYFHNLFKNATGKALRDYVEEQRIKKAANMIVTTDATLTEVAYECGFSSQSYFSYAFKRRMGATPREYQRSVIRKYETDSVEN